jgi:hypothetical protein
MERRGNSPVYPADLRQPLERTTRVRRPPADPAGRRVPGRLVAAKHPLPVQARSALPAGRPVAEPSAPPSPPSPDRPVSPQRRARSVTVVIVIIIMLLVAGGVKIVLSWHGGRGRAAGAVGTAGATGVAGASEAELTAARQAAQWVSRQVGQHVIVACDPVMCSALKARGLSTADLLVLENAGTDPLRAGVVVVTPTVRGQFGTRMDSVYAPAVLAGFGSGTARVSVQVTAAHGAAAYLVALRQDMTARKAAGIELLANKRIGETAQARTQLAQGNVDSRLLLMLPALAGIHPIQILALGDPGPQAGQGIPSCSADLSDSGSTAGIAEARYLSSQAAFVRAQPQPFSGSAAVLQQGHERILRVQFSQPGPLGLLGHG